MSSPLPSLAGTWIGGFDDLQIGWVALIVHFTADPTNSLSGTVDLPLAGITATPLTDVALTASGLRFSLPHAMTQFVFEGRTTPQAIHGIVRHNGVQVPFALARGAQVDDHTRARYMGTYQYAPDAFLVVANLLGSSTFTYVDLVTGAIRGLHPASPTRFFCGPSLFMAVPPTDTLTFVTTHSGEVTGLRWRRPDRSELIAPKLPLQYYDIQFHNGDVTLAGTLVLPPTAGPHPAVVLIHGSGPQQRSCVRLHAEIFARHGIAALMYDKRGTGESTGVQRDDFDALAADALAGIHALQQRPDVRATQVGLCGSSQAGWVGPLAAAQSPEVAFLVLLAGPAVSVAQQNISRIAAQMRADGYDETAIAEAQSYTQRLFAQIRGEDDDWDGLQAAAVWAQTRVWSAFAIQPWSADLHEFRQARDFFFREYADVFAAVRCPVLALFGERDWTVVADENRTLMEQALRRGHCRDYTLITVPRASHLFLDVEVNSSKEFPHVQKIVRAYVDTMVKWVLERVQVDDRPLYETA